MALKGIIFHMTDVSILSRIVDISTAYKLKVRLIFADWRVSQWGDWVLLPDNGYIEVQGVGPVKQADIQAIDICSTTSGPAGKYVSPVKIDHSKDLRDGLRFLGDRCVQESEYFRVTLI